MSPYSAPALTNQGYKNGYKLPARETAEAPEEVIDIISENGFFKHDYERQYTISDCQEPSRHTARPKNRRARKRKKCRGWRPTTGLKWKEVKEISSISHMADEAGLSFNLFVSISPSSDQVSDTDRKRACYKLEGNFSDRLKRRGVPFLALRVFEKRANGNLHMHLLVHVPKNLLDESVTWSNAITDIKIRERHHIAYITKQRHPLKPDFERVTKHQRQRGSAFKGRRWSISKKLSAALGL